LLLSLRFRTVKTLLLLSLRFRTVKTLLLLSHRAELPGDVGATDVFCAKA